MTARWTIAPISAPFRSVVRVPGSKSITNRALPLAAMTGGTTTLEGVLFADDTRHMLAALEAAGYAIVVDEAAARVRVSGRGRRIPRPSDPFAKPLQISCGNSGTTMRFLTAMLSLGHGRYVLDGVKRMRERPIGQLVDALRQLGAEVIYEGEKGFPPVRVGGFPMRGGMCLFHGAMSSQYISAVLMAAPMARRTTYVQLTGAVASEPYVRMTVRMMEQLGVEVATKESRNHRTYIVEPQPYCAGSYRVEPDASNASYFLAAAAITPGATVTIPGLGSSSLQGDVAFASLLEEMGATVTIEEASMTLTGGSALTGVDVDMSSMPDMVQTLAVVALFARGPTTARNIWNLRIKETDRLAALERELAKLGATVTTGNDWIRVEPPAKLKAASIATYEDHRMAMAFAVAALRSPGIVIEDPGCTAKTYPGYFDDLAAMVAP